MSCNIYAVNIFRSPPEQAIMQVVDYICHEKHQHVWTSQQGGAVKRLSCDDQEHDVRSYAS